jgi:molybdopterin-binding protein
MGKLEAQITDIKNFDTLNIVTFDFYGNELTMMSLELQDDIQVGTKVILSVKSTAITFAKDFHGEISISNRLDATIKDYKKGELLCSVQLLVHDIIFETFITVAMFNKLDLQIDDKVTIFIKASDISISEVING